MPQLFKSILNGNVTLTVYLVSIAVSLVCGLITAFAVSIKNRISKSFATALVLLPAIVCTVITVVNGNIGTGILVMGVFALIRFRSVPCKAKDIVAIFLSMTAGITCAAGYVAIAVLCTLIVCVIMMIISVIPMNSDAVLELKITVPESLDAADAFKELFNEYTVFTKLVKIKTTDMGSLFRYTYLVRMKNRNDAKKFIDAIRTRNGNLEISLGEPVERAEEL